MSKGRIALYGAGGSPYHHAVVFARGGHEVEFVFPEDILAGALEGFDAFVMPGGGYRAMLGQIEPLGADGARALRAYVEGGGMYIGCCAGSYDAATVPEVFLAACPAQAEMCLLGARVWNDGGGEEWGGLRSPGVGVLRAETAAPEHPVMAGMPASFEIAHYNGPLFTGAQPLARVAGRTERFTPWEHMLGDASAHPLIDDAPGIANIVAGPCGEGRVVLFGSHPEFGFGVAMEDEQPPARMLLNAIAWQLEEHAIERPRIPIVAERESEAEPVGEHVAALHERTAALRALGTNAKWLGPGYAMSTFGRSGVEIWSASLDAIDRLADATAERADATEPRVLGFRPDAELDGGYHGVIPLLEQSLELLDRALADWHFDPGEPGGNPYRHMLDSPYHLVAGSYLAAVGRVGAAALLCEAFERVAAV
jgi:Biotin-protein ligase, N terminal